MESDKQKSLEEIRKITLKIGKAIEKDPRMMICSLHKATNKEVKLLREEKSWRGIASATSNDKCSNQICGWFLCIVAGLDKGPWEEE